MVEQPRSFVPPLSATPLIGDKLGQFVYIHRSFSSSSSPHFHRGEVWDSALRCVTLSKTLKHRHMGSIHHNATHDCHATHNAP